MDLIAIHGTPAALVRGWGQWAAADPTIAESATVAFGPVWDDVFTLAGWDLRIKEVSE